jgi:hypothetical protein
MMVYLFTQLLLAVFAIIIVVMLLLMLQKSTEYKACHTFVKEVSFYYS